MRDQVTVSITIEIHDPEAFAMAALQRARDDGLDDADLESTYSPDNLSACAIMLFDPGVSPPGCSIQDSSAE